VVSVTDPYGRNLGFLERTAKPFLQYFTCLGKKHYREGMFRFVKLWDKYLKAKDD
jgi:hypothetical protein